MHKKQSLRIVDLKSKEVNTCPNPNCNCKKIPAVVTYFVKETLDLNIHGSIPTDYSVEVTLLN